MSALREVEGKTPVSYVGIENGTVSPIRKTVQRSTLFANAITEVVGHKFSGTIRSTAIAANFKDFQIKLTYLASNGSEISSQNFTIYKTCRAGRSENFELKIERPDQTSRYTYLILGAMLEN